MKNLLLKYLATLRSKINIYQEQYKSSDNVQEQNIHIYLTSQEDLNKLKYQIIQRVASDFTAFEEITELLLSLDTNQLSEPAIDMMIVWLRKIVAQYHIRYAASNLEKKQFELHMLDTSLYDQAADIWLNHPDFIRVVKADSEFSKCTHPRKITRTFFVKDAEQLKKDYQFIIKTVENQVSEGITIFVARADIIKKIDENLVRDLFLIPKYAVCDIEKPFWKHVLSTDPSIVKKFTDIVKTIHKHDSVIKINQENINKLPNLILELQQK